MNSDADSSQAASEETRVDAGEKKAYVIKRLLRKAQCFTPHLKRAWQETKLFGSQAWRGAAIGSLAAFIAFMAYMGFFLRTGLGRAADTALSVLLGTLGAALVGLLIMLIVTILRAWPRLFSGAFLGAVTSFVLLFVFFGPSPGLPLRIGSTLVLLLATMGASIAVVFRRRETKPKASHRVAAGVLMVLSLSTTVVLFVWLASGGTDPYLELQATPSSGTVSSLNAPNPSEPGSYKVGTLFYGSGTDKRRPEYGKLVTLKTDTADATPFVKKKLKGFKAKVRKWYWGFGADHFPINGRVWFPEGEGPFPLVLIVHGNHQMEEFSDPGYAYLGELLASRGFITVSMDENFLNGSWAGDIGGENGARGWILLKHLAAWRTWNETAGNPFYRKVDLENIALIGHSRGGEAIAHAAAFNKLDHFPDDANVRFHFHFSIKSLIAIAPIDGQYQPADQPVPVENVNYLVLHGSHDGDVSFFAGFRPYRRVKFTDGRYWMKSALYVYRANHGQFNTVWGSYDMGPPLDHFLNQKPLLKGEEQRQLAKVYVSAFLEATLHGRREYIPLFRDHRVIAGWLPETIYFSQFEDSNYRVVSNFDNSIDVTRTTVPGGVQLGENLTVWREQEWKGRSDWPFRNKAVFLGWENQESKAGTDAAEKMASYSVTLPDGLAREWQLSENASLVFSVADTDEDPHKAEGEEEEKTPGVEKKEETRKKDEKKKKAPLDFTVELVGTNGSTARVALSRFFPLQPVLKVKFTKWSYLEQEFYKSPTEPVFQTYELPLSAFVKAGAGFNPASLKTIRFRFDRTQSGVILLDEVGFATEKRRVTESRKHQALLAEPKRRLLAHQRQGKQSKEGTGAGATAYLSLEALL